MERLAGPERYRGGFHKQVRYLRQAKSTRLIFGRINNCSTLISSRLEDCLETPFTLCTGPAAGVASLSLGSLPAMAQGAADWPQKPVRILTPFPAGAGPEVVLRLVADRLQKMWGKPVVVENRPGGNGFIAIRALKSGDKDGYDLIQLDNVHVTAYPYLFKQLPYDPKGDFELLAPLFKASFFFAVADEQPVQERCRPRRRREGQARQPQLRLVVDRQPCAPWLGSLRVDDRDQDGPRRLQRNVAAVHRCRERRHRVGARQLRHVGRRCSGRARSATSPSRVRSALRRIRTFRRWPKLAGRRTSR